MTYTDKEKDILGKYSSSLFTLNTFYTASKTIVGRTIKKDTEKFLLDYWNNVVEHMAQWQELQHREITKVDFVIPKSHHFRQISLHRRCYMKSRIRM